MLRTVNYTAKYQAFRGGSDSIVLFQNIISILNFNFTNKKSYERNNAVLFSNWLEVYFTSEMEKCFIAKNLLNEQGISYKTDIINNNLRLSMNNLGNMSPALCRDGNVKDYYKILVKKKDVPRAKHLLSRI